MSNSIMDKLIQDGVLGIVTGILTTALLYFAKSLWEHKLRPLMEELRYRGVKVDGRWNGKGSGKNSAGEDWQTEMLLFLSQSALNLGGTFSLKHNSPENSFELHFNVSGHIWEGYVILNLTPIDRRVTSYATCLLKIGGGGVTLIGQMAYRDVNQEQVVTEPMSLQRPV